MITIRTRRSWSPAAVVASTFLNLFYARSAAAAAARRRRGGGVRARVRAASDGRRGGGEREANARRDRPERCVDEGERDPVLPTARRRETGRADAGTVWRKSCF